jgi:hypothetical protein
MRLYLLLLPFALPIALPITLACESKPAETPKSVEMVPIGNEADAAAAPPTSSVAKGDDPPEVTPVTTSAAPPPTASASASAGPGGPRISAKECDKLVDRYIDLAIAGDGRLAGVTAEMIASAKAQVKAQKGMGPCDEQVVTKKQYACAIAAKTTDAYQACLK